MSAFTTVGDVRYEGGKWRIQCEPHVRTRLRRVFPQVNQRAAEVLWLSDTAESCRELLWFIQRYPLAVDRLDYLEARAKSHEETETLIARLLAKADPVPDFELAKPPREYQREAAALVEIKSGLLIADQVGLGKTITAICSMARQKNLPCVVVCWAHLTTQWKEKVEEFAPSLKVHVVRDGPLYDLTEVKKKRKKAAAGQGSLFEAGEEERLPDVIIITYSKLQKWSESLCRIARLAAFDEIQDLRHDSTNKYHAAKLLSAACNIRIGLSATPIHNYGIEFYNVMEILFPGALGTKDEFQREWCNGDVVKDPIAFGAYLRREGMMIRRSRKDVGRELPPAQRVVHQIESDPAELERIKGSAIDLAKVILSSQQAYRGQKFMANREFDVMMRQATGIAKAPYVAQFVRMLLEEEDKIIVFAWHREVYEILRTLLAEFKPRLFTGTESPAQKEATKKAFIDGDCRVVLMSLRAGAGTDGMQEVCKVGVIAELDYTASVHEQCEGRYVRDGQEEGAMTYFLVTEDGSDPIISDIVGLKKQQSVGVLEQQSESFEDVQPDPEKVKRMARGYLERMGVDVPCVDGTQAKAVEEAQAEAA